MIPILIPAVALENWNTYIGFIGASLDFHKSNKNHGLSLLFLGNSFLSFTIF